MTGWVVTLVLAVVIARIIWVEVRCGRRFKENLSTTNEQIKTIRRHATARYRAKFGKDPTEPFRTVDLTPTPSKKA